MDSDVAGVGNVINNLVLDFVDDGCWKAWLVERAANIVCERWCDNLMVAACSVSGSVLQN